jgi:lipoprotein NlpI
MMCLALSLSFTRLSRAVLMVVWLALWAADATAQSSPPPDLIAACLQPQQPPPQLLQTCTRAIESGTATGSKLAAVRSARGLALRDLGRFDEAMTELDAAIALDPGATQPLLYRGTTYTFLGQHERAITDLQAAIHKDNGLAGVFLEMGRSLAAARRYAAAMPYFDAALGQHPNNAEILAMRARALNSSGEPLRALPNIDEAVSRAPDAIRYRMARASIRNNSGDHAGALSDYQFVLEREPNNGFARYQRGLSYFDAGRFAEAAQDFKEHRRLRPDWLFGAIWLYLTRTRAGENGRAELEQVAAGTSLGEWPGAIIEMLLERISPEDLLDSAIDTDEQKERDRTCEALFYIGEYYLIKGDRAAAARALRGSIAMGVTDFIEYVRAGVELKRLGF